MSTSSRGQVCFLSVVLFLVTGIFAVCIMGIVSFWDYSYFSWYSSSQDLMGHTLGQQGLSALLSWSFLFALYLIVNLSGRCCCRSRTWVNSVMCDLIALSFFALYGLASGVVCLTAGGLGRESGTLSLVACLFAGVFAVIVAIMLIGWIFGEGCGVKRRYGGGMGVYKKSLRTLRKETKKKNGAGIMNGMPQQYPMYARPGQPYMYPQGMYQQPTYQQGMYAQQPGFQSSQPGFQAPQPAHQLDPQNTSNSASYSTKSLIPDASTPDKEMPPPVNTVTYHVDPAPAPPVKDMTLPNTTTYTITDSGVPIRGPADYSAPLSKP